MKLLREGLQELERELENLGWVNMNDPMSSSQLQAQESYEKMVRRCRLGFIKSPLIAQAVYLTTYYTFGYGIQKPKAPEGDENLQELINSFWCDPDNVLSFTGTEAQLKLSNKLQYDGEICLMLQVDTDGSVFVRVVDPLSIAEVIYSPVDNMRPLLYKRRVRGAVDKFEYVPDWQNGAAIMATCGEEGPMEQQLLDMRVPESSPFRERAFIMQVKVNNDALDARGVPEVWRALDWVNSNTKIAGDMASFINAQSQYAWEKKIKGTAQQVRTAAARIRQNPQMLNNPSYQAGATIVANEGVENRPIALPSSSGTLFDGGIRRTLLMVCASFGIMEHYFGDPSTGNLATATAMELPMLKKFQARQKLWEGVYDAVIRFQLLMSRGVLQGSGSLDYKEMRNRAVLPDNDEMKEAPIDIDFPPILEKEIKSTSEAWAQAKKEGLAPIETCRRMFMASAGINNVDEEMDKEFQEPAPAMPFGASALDPNAQDPNAQDPKTQETVRQVSGKWYVYSELGKRLGGPYESRSEADTRLKQVEYFKKRGQRVRESVTSKSNVKAKAPAVKLADKNKAVIEKMGGYLKEIAGAYNSFNKKVLESAKTSQVSSDGKWSLKISGLDEACDGFEKSMLEAAGKYLPQAVAMGRQYVGTKVKEAARTDKWTREQLGWNEGFVSGSLVPAMRRKLAERQYEFFETEGEAMDAARKAVASFESRVASYASAFWTVSERTVKEEAGRDGLEANFVGVDDESNCEECQAAIDGNPWPAREIPIPGEQECMSNCRHAIQITGDQELTPEDVSFLRESEAAYRKGMKILESNYGGAV